MASPHEPLLASPKPTKRACKALCFTLSLVAVVLSTALITLQFSTHQSLQPSDLCTQSPNPASCHVIVGDALLLGGPRPSPVGVFQSILSKSLLSLDSTIARANDLHRLINQSASLADCLHLMDLSRDHVSRSTAAAVAGASGDARTWMSAVLTNYDTCLDGLEGPARLELEAQLQALMSLASASLAVLNSVSLASNADVEAIVRFPSWVSYRDRKLLEVSSPKAINANVVVAKDGSGKYKTVQEAINSAPDGGKSRYVIYVKKGVYKEKVDLGTKKTNVMVVGDGMDATIITGSLNVIDGSTTFNSATFAAVGEGVILQDLKIENTAGPQKHQAVALRVGADKAVINRCKLEAYQDTLYTHTLRQFYRDCTISGTVDFIFGNAAVLFQNCILTARKPMSNQQNLVTAQGRTDPNQNTGTSIQNCQVSAASDLLPVTGSIPTYLGRPWKEYSRTVYMQSNLGGHIHPKGWLEWDGNFALNTLFYGEYQNWGPGAGTAGRVKWRGFKVITDVKTAQSFTVAGLLGGGSWIKSAGVTYKEGL